MGNKTAVQRLIDYMRANFYLTDRSEIEFTDSLAMEEEQIKDAYNEGYRDGERESGTTSGGDISTYNNANNYYNDTFKN